MSLAPGSRLGPYEIVSVLGAGGMGEVYRATDTMLKRQVAIKVLPDAFAHESSLAVVNACRRSAGTGKLACVGEGQCRDAGYRPDGVGGR